MAAKFLVKRSSVSGQAPNTSQLTTGELALNLTDGIMYGSNGSVIFEIGANLSSLSVNSISFPTTDGTNGQVLVTNGSGGLSFANPSGGANVQIVTGIQYDTFKFSITSNTTVLSGQDDDGVILFYSAGSEDVYQNGLKLIAGDDYTQTDSGTITLTSNAVSGDTIEILNIVGHSTINEFTYTVSANQTIFTGNDDNLNLLGYTLGREMVYVNGVKLIHTDDYTTPNSTHIILTANAVSGDVVEVVSFERGNGDIVTDSSPQLGGFLDLNNNDITGTGNININGSITAGNSTVNAVIASSGNIDTDGTLTVAGQALFNGSTTVNNTFVANGATTIANTLAAGNTTITGFANISSNLTVSSVATFGSDVTVSGNLVVTGTRIFANTTTVDLGDNIITLNADLASNIAPSENSGIEVNRGSGSNVSLLWNETSDSWTLTNDGSTYYDIATNNFVTSTYAPLASPAFTGNANFDTDVLFIDSINDRVGIKTTTPGVTLDVSSAVDAFHLPSGNTAQRPSGSGGMLRFNTDTSKFEIYTTTWGDLDSGTSTFTTDSFTANGSQTAFTLSQTPTDENSLIIFNEGVFQNQDAYTLSGNTVTFDTAPGSGNKIVAYSVKAAVSGSNLNQDTFTANGTQTAFTLTVNPIDERNTQVFIDGVYQQKDAYTVSGTTLTFGAAPSNGTTVEVMTFTQTSINVPTSNSINSTMIQNGQIVSAALANSISTNNITVNQDLTVTGDTTLNGNIVLGSNTSDVVSFNGLVNTHIIPAANVTYDLGSSTNSFRDLYLSGSSIKLGSQTITANATHFSIGTAELSSANGMLYARQEDIDTAVANLVASAPGTLDTLNEIATALGSDPDLANTLTTSIATKAANSYVNTELALKAPLADPTFTGNATFDTSTLFVDGTNNRVGIGTSGPSALLHLKDDFTNGVAITLDRTENSIVDTLFHIGVTSSLNAANDRMWFGTATTDLTITDDGYVGIGTSSPTTPLQVVSTAGDWTADIKNYSTDAYGLRVDLSGSTGTAFAQATYTATGTGFFVKNDGIVGIGTSTPSSSKLHVQGDGLAIKLDGTANTTRSIFFRNTTSSNPAQLYSDGSLRLYTEDAGTDIRFHTVSNGTNNERMRIDSSGRVRIGASGGTGQRLSINGFTQSDTMSEANAWLVAEANGGDGIAIGTRATSPYATWIQSCYLNTLGTSNHYALALNPYGGNVGIGTGSPYSKLWVSGPGINPSTELNTDDVNSNALLTLAGNNSLVRLQMGTMDVAPFGAWIQGSYDNNSVGGDDGVEPLALNPIGGNVGIGTSNPAQSLEVVDSDNYQGVHIRGSQAPCLTWAQNLSTTPSWRAGISGYAGDSFAISTGASVGDLVMVKPTGEFLLNRTSIFGTAGAASMIITGRSASCAYWTAPNVANYDIHTFFNGGLGVIGTIRQNSSLNGVAYNTSSDYRLKENVSYDWDATTRLKQLKPCRFNWISDETNTLEDGFLAHEVATAVPNAVTGEKDAMIPAVLYEETDQEVIDGKAQVGDIKEEEKINPQQLDHSKLVPLLVKTIQELEARITELENA